MEDKITVHKSWRWGPLSAASWTALAYLLAVLIFTLARLGQGFPLYSYEEYITGSYPLILLVYICIPLLARDTYLFFRGRLKATAELKGVSLTLVLCSLLAYRYVFGWLY